MQEKLYHLKPIKPRDFFENEPQHFTPWLAKEENLSFLGETLNMDLEFEAQEIEVGDLRVRADLVCRNSKDDTRVLIENQLEETDYKHLGQILTYAAGLDVHTFIWIAKDFRDEHRAALDQLNEMTETRFRFFGIEIKMWVLEGLARALSFEIVSKPNDWNLTIRPAAVKKNISEKDKQHKKFWTVLRDYMREKDSQLRFPKPSREHFLKFSIGSSNFSLQPYFRTRDKAIGITLYVKGENATAHFHLLKEQQAEIENEFGEPLEWEETPKNKSHKIYLRKEETAPLDESDWPNQHEWLASRLELFYEVFLPRIEALNAADWVPPEDEDDA